MPQLRPWPLRELEASLRSGAIAERLYLIMQGLNVRLLLQRESLGCRRVQRAFQSFLVCFLGCVLALLCSFEERVIAAAEARPSTTPGAVQLPAAVPPMSFCIAVNKRHLLLEYLGKFRASRCFLTKNKLRKDLLSLLQGQLSPSRCHSTATPLAAKA